MTEFECLLPELRCLLGAAGDLCGSTGGLVTLWSLGSAMAAL